MTMKKNIRARNKITLRKLVKYTLGGWEWKRGKVCKKESSKSMLKFLCYKVKRYNIESMKNCKRRKNSLLEILLKVFLPIKG